jgi:hypothetical protein
MVLSKKEIERRKKEEKRQTMILEGGLPPTVTAGVLFVSFRRRQLVVPVILVTYILSGCRIRGSTHAQI